MINNEKFVIAVIGMGAVGVAFLTNFIEKIKKNEAANIKILIFEKSKELGPGIPYQNDLDSLILNRTASNMSIKKTDPDHFVKWLRKNHYPSIYAESYLPRNIFGKYLKSTLNDVLNIAIAINLEIEFIPCGAKEISKKHEKYHITGCQNEIRFANQILLSTGNLPSNNYFHLISNKGYYHTPYPIKTIINEISDNLSIGIIGSRLSAIDTVLSLKKSNHKGSITLLSRKGYLPTIQSKQEKTSLMYCTEDRIKNLQTTSDGYISYRTVLRLILKELSYGNEEIFNSNYYKPKEGNSVEIFDRDLNSIKNGNRWQSSFVALNSVIGDLWKLMKEEDKVKFMHNDFSRFMALRVPIPLESAFIINNMFKKGELNLLSGLECINYSNNTFIAEFKKAKSLNFDIIINCTGTDNDIQKTTDPLYLSLINNRLIIPHPLGGIHVDFYNNEAISINKASKTGIYAVGNMTTGVHLFCSVLENNVRHCENVVQAILNEYHSTYKLLA